MQTYKIMEGHPALKMKCGLCGTQFKAGDEVVFLNEKPVDQKEMEHMRAGRPYTVVATELAHIGCA